eukprot:TRINITY_DN102344_c0_g1_i1.p2 TRINITY_DN102344_c0_g1~~TRINITY_DN102344_c0_g1_i1.p2  ORF type:complete len:128 (+),score=52.90 TRINITY_DN102344_c0_g1_i1:59-442(+)
MSYVNREEETEADVTWEDQQKICAFGRLNTRALAIEEEIKEKKEEIEKIADASNELWIADDVKLVLGEAFVDMDASQVDTLLTEKKEKAEGDIGNLTAELTEIQTKMKELKGQLYAKFGKSIYLENE